MPVDARALDARGCPLDLFTAVAAALGDRWVTPEQFRDLVAILAAIHAHNEALRHE